MALGRCAGRCAGRDAPAALRQTRRQSGHGASLYIFDVTPAECWQWLCNVGGSVHEKGLAVHEQNAARRAERLAERAAEEAAAEEYEDYDDDLPEDEVGEGEDHYGGEEPAAPALSSLPAGWLASSTGVIR